MFKYSFYMVSAFVQEAYQKHTRPNPKTEDPTPTPNTATPTPGIPAQHLNPLHPAPEIWDMSFK